MLRRFVFAVIGTTVVTTVLTACGHSARMVPQLPASAKSAASVARPNTSYGFSGIRATFQHSVLSDDAKLLTSYVKAYGATTVFVPVTADDISTLTDANPTAVAGLNALTSAAKVYFVAGDASWLATPGTEPSVVTQMASVAKLYPNVAGIYYLVDPESSSSWSSNRQTVVNEYTQLVQTLLAAPSAASFKQTFFLTHVDFSSILTGGTTGPSLLQYLQSQAKTTGVAVLLGGHNGTNQYDTISPILSQLTKPFWIETNSSKYVTSSYYSSTPSEIQQNVSTLLSDVNAHNANVIGIEMNGWSDLYDSLQGPLPQPNVYNGVLAGGPQVPATGTTYLGAFVNPNGTGPSPTQTAAFETQIGRALAYNMHFHTLQEVFPETAERDDIAHGRIPLVAWNCGDTNARVASGADDTIITNEAKAIAAFKKPIMIRWFWEMNLNESNDGPRNSCYDAANDWPNGYFSPKLYIAAWRHIHQIFVANGATNAIWVFCVANAHGGAAQYYPGDDVVDWVAMDDYDIYSVSMYKTFYALANVLSQFQQKPFMIAETGAYAATQPSFLADPVAVLKTNFPWVRAIGYLDSSSRRDWVLGSQGLSEFATWGHDPYMSAMPQL